MPPLTNAKRRARLVGEILLGGDRPTPDRYKLTATVQPVALPQEFQAMFSEEDAGAPDVTAMLVAWSGGEHDAPDALMNAVYGELRRQAARAMNREPEHATLQATALVHEAYLRLVDQRRVNWRNRSHFFGIAAQLMRRILVDHARGRLADKRGGNQTAVTLTESGANAPHAGETSVDVIALHDALERLAQLDPEQARIVELRYFGGLTIEETAEATGVGPTTVKAEWAIARAWLRRELGDP